MIDANADRTAEGLRVIGDITRFLLNDPALSATWRSIRSELWAILGSVPGLLERGLQNRDSGGDVGREFQAAPHADIPQMAKTNIHRAQESLRVLEESMRSLDSATVPRLSSLRYRCYEAEPLTIQALDQWSLARKLDFGLYVVLGQEFSHGRDFLEVTQKAIAGGAGAIQLRAKDTPKREILDWARRLRDLTRQQGVTFIINDHLDIALAVEADGVHLGQEDFPIREARRIVGPAMILGASTHSIEEAQAAVADGASYINIGPIFKTGTKKNVMDPVGVELIPQVTSVVSLPYTVMGGIKLDNVDAVLRKGARRIAVVTAVVAAEDITLAARQFSEKIDRYRQQNPSTQIP